VWKTLADHLDPSLVLQPDQHVNILHSAGFVRQKKKAEEDATFCLINEGIVFSLFLSNDASTLQYSTCFNESGHKWSNKYCIIKFHVILRRMCKLIWLNNEISNQ
jgi:hypothetical protein